MYKLSNNNMLYLVTGICGFIGSHIAEELVKQGKHVIGIDDLSNGTTDNFQPWWDDKLCTFHHTSILDFQNNLFKLFRDVDVVFHEACAKCTSCMTHPYLDLLTNAWGSWQVFEGSRQAKVKRVIYASTGSVMDGEPTSFYGASKLTAESYLKAFKSCYPNFEYTILRYYNVYGTRQDDSLLGGVIPIFIKRIYNNEPIIIYGTGEQERRFTHVSDVVEANLLVSELSRTEGKILNVVSDTRVTILNLAHALYRIMDKKPWIYFEDWQLGDIMKFDVEAYKLAAFGKNTYKDFEQGLIETVDWYTNKYSYQNDKNIQCV